MKKNLTSWFGALFLALFLAGCGGGGGGSNVGNTGALQPADNSKPVVIATSPPEAAVSVGITSAITATFSEKMDSATLTAQTFTVVANGTGTAVQGTVTYDEANRTAVFTHDVLAPNTTYTATITKGIRDLAGNAAAANYSWIFTTGDTPDITPPAVLATMPAQNAGNVAINTAIASTFSEDMDLATINAQTVTLLQNGSTPVAGSVTCSGRTAVFKPASNLSANTPYTAVITTGVKDLAGNALAANYSWNFTTGSIPDTAPPQVVSSTPLNGAVNVPVNTPFVTTFDEPMMPFEFGQVNDRPVAVTFDSTYSTITMQPTGNLQPGVTYTFQIRLEDMAGNPMSGVYAVTFTTQQ